MEKASPLQEYMKCSSFSVIGMVGISCYILADTFFVAKGLGTNGLAALNLAIPIYNFIHGCGLMLGMGGATKFSIYKSRNESRLANVMFTNTAYLGVIFSAVFVMIGLFLSESLTSLLGADADVFDMTNTYLKVMLLFSPAFLFNDILLCFVRNDGNPRIAMFAMIGGSLSNVVLDYIFIFPCGMGIFGAVFATGLAPLIGILIMAPHWIGKRRGFYLVKTKLHFSMARLNVSLGFPSLIAQLSSGIVMITFNGIILHLQGNVGVAAYGVVANLSLVVISVYTGISQGVQPLISHSYGHSDWKTIKLLLRYSMISMIIVSCVLYLVIFLFSEPIAGLFNSENNPHLQEIATMGLQLYFTSSLFVGFNIILSIFFTSIEIALPAHILSLLRGLFVIVPMAFLLSTLWGMTGVWLAFPITECLVALLGGVFYLRYRSVKRWQKN